MINYFTRHPTAANLLMLSMILVGLMVIPTIKRETFPEFESDFVQAQIVQPGAAPQDAEENLCQRMEDAVDGLSDIEEVRCEAVEGMATLTLKLNSGTDISRMLLDVQTQINAVKDFPDEAEPPVVTELSRTKPVMDVALVADLPASELKAYAEQLKRRIKLEAGVKLVTINGFSDHQILVELSLTDIRRLGLSVGDIADKLRRQNVRLPSGTIETHDKNLLIRFDEQKVTPAALAETVISSNTDGGIVRLGDVAVLTDRFELDEEHVLFDGKPAAILSISKNKEEDVLKVKEDLLRLLDEIRPNLPAGVTLQTTNDMSSLVSDRLSMMIKNGLQGVFLVFLTMWLFFSLRYSFWVAMGLPVAFLAAVAMMPLFGLSINVMTLVAFLMAIGIMMDDAIVIAESIASHVERGMERSEAIVAGVKKVAPGVLSSFLTTVFIFSSLLFLDGQMGNVLKVVPLTLLLILTISLLEAFLILPNHLSHALSKNSDGDAPRGIRAWFHQHFEAFRNNQLVNAVEWVVKWRYGFLGAIIALFLLSLSLVAGGAVKFIGFPELDGDIVEARVVLPPGATLMETKTVVEKIVAAAEKVDERFSAEEVDQSYVQHLTEKFNFNNDAKETGPHVATVRLDLLSAELRQGSIHEFIRQWREETGELAAPLSMVFKQPEMGPAGRAIEIRIRHDDLYLLKQVSTEVQQYLSNFQGVYGLLDTMRPGKEEILVTLRPGAEVYGIDGQMLASQLRGAYFHQTADEIQVGPENIQIDVKLAKADAAKLSNLLNFPINVGDKQVPLASLAEIAFQRGFVRIERIDGLRTISVLGDVDVSQANTNEVLQLFRNELMPQLLAKHPGLRIEFEGEVKESAKTGSSMGKGFLLGLFGVFAILSLQFKSYLEPVTVMVAIPLALIGVLWGHLLLGYSLSMPSVMGFVSLAGIVVNDSILLVQYIRHHVEEGDSVHEAVVQASRERFRAVFITSMTTAAGMLPLMLETSLQAQVLKPLVISVVFGIFASTALVLFMVPAFYSVLDDFGKVSFANKQDAH
ncbi:AcrB/AcrD/AcrF family protein [Corallincola holothuriorum]|uniref:AcrB/AcrD/AcrF family protein n=1 Tax=Corallincola holothuriorum TaxID=2282215 RepID=A0A368NGB5_9GAMM|nr:efflux RND transporter permease subunit [Corallincola holothuriorum]RCU49508.1 AcrB/AcrD/AcrF family protein [Corallincola holothuriorum]